MTFVGLFLFSGFVNAEMSSTNYSINWDSINTGGIDTATSTSYELSDTVGEIHSAASTSTSYRLEDGYRAGLAEDIISFDIQSQIGANRASVSSIDGTNITCASTNFSAGDFVVLIQDLGATQVAAVGRVTETAENRVTLDELSDGGTAPVIDGFDDYLYHLSGLTAALGSLELTSIKTHIIGFDVTADIENGYTIYLSETGSFRNGSYDIDDVADGAVTIGNEEYGARSSDTTLVNSTFDTADTAITQDNQEVVTETARIFDSKHYLTLKAAVASDSVNAIYTHTIKFIISGNF